MPSRAWAAGFFDGEGCFSYSQAGRYASASIGQSERWPLERFQEATGLGTIDASYRHKARPGVISVFHRAGLPLPVVATAVVQSTHRRQLAWAAGLFDADGCFSYTDGARIGCASITQADSSVLHRFRESVGVGKIYGPYVARHQDSWSRKPHYFYRAQRFEDVQAVIAQLWFMLGPSKRQQAVSVLKRIPRTCRRGHAREPSHQGCGQCVKEYWRTWRHRKGTAMTLSKARSTQAEREPAGPHPRP
jgi:hypothetical protein